jgi:hypothetical protein
MSRWQSFVGAVLAGAALLALWAAPARTQDKPDSGKEAKETTARGQVQVGTHQFKMEAGKLYLIRVEGQGFRPNVTMRGGYFTNSSFADDGDTFQGYFMPRETKNYRLFVLPSLNDDIEGGSLDYKVIFKSIPLAAKPLLQEKGELTATDPIYSNEDGNKSNGPHKAYKVKLKAKQMYIIDMVRGSRELDPYLMLEGSSGKIVAVDDDGGGDSNARIIFQPRRAGEYRIIATTASKEIGPFTLTVRSTEE